MKLNYLKSNRKEAVKSICILHHECFAFADTLELLILNIVKDLFLMCFTYNAGKSMELHEVKMVNPNVFMGMDVVKRCLFLQDQRNPLTKV